MEKTVKCSCGKIFRDRYNYETKLEVSAKSQLKIHIIQAKEGVHKEIK